MPKPSVRKRKNKGLLFFLIVLFIIIIGFVASSIYVLSSKALGNHESGVKLVDSYTTLDSGKKAQFPVPKSAEYDYLCCAIVYHFRSVRSVDDLEQDIKQIAEEYGGEEIVNRHGRKVMRIIYDGRRYQYSVYTNDNYPRNDSPGPLGNLIYNYINVSDFWE